MKTLGTVEDALKSAKEVLGTAEYVAEVMGIHLAKQRHNVEAVPLIQSTISYDYRLSHTHPSLAASRNRDTIATMRIKLIVKVWDRARLMLFMMLLLLLWRLLLLASPP
jgi:hypothetical protein